MRRVASTARFSFMFQLITEDCFEGHQGFDLIDFDTENKLCKKLRVKKTTLISELYEILGQQMVSGYPLPRCL